MPLSVRQHQASALGVLVAMLGWLFLTVTGVEPGNAALLTGVVGVQAWAAGYLWRAFTGGHRAAEVVGMGLALGTAAALMSGLAVKLATGTNLGWAVPAVVAIAVGVIRRARRPTRPPSEANWDAGSIVGTAAAVVVGTASLVPNLLSYPLTWTGLWSRYHGDMLFFEALSTSLARLGPLDSLFSPDMQVRYHWLVYAWSGQVSETVDAAPFVALTRVLPYVAVVGSGLIAVAWARRLSSASWVPLLAVMLLVTGGYVGATYGAVFNFDSPSISMTVLWLLAFGLVLVRAVEDWDSTFATWAMVVTIAILGFALAGGKISSGAIAVAGALWLALVGWLGKRTWRAAATILAAVTAGAFGAGYLLVVAGSADPGGLRLFDLLDRASSVQGLNPVQGSVGIVLGTGILLVAVAARWAGMVWLLADPRSRWRVDTQLGVGFALAAVVTVVALSGGLNDTWFALAASAPLAVLSAAGAGEAWLALPRRRGRALLAIGVVALVAFAIVAGLWLTGASGGNVWVSTWRWLGPLAGVLISIVGGALACRWLTGRSRAAGLAGAVLALVALSAVGRLLGVGSGQAGVQPGLSSDAFSPVISFTDSIDATVVTGWSDQQVAAARWLTEHSTTDDLVATNVTFSPLVPALTGMRTLVSGILYQAPYGRPAGIPVLAEREEISHAFLDDPSRSTLAPLCAAGVRWAWVDAVKNERRDWSPFARVAYENDEVILLEIDEPACT